MSKYIKFSIIFLLLLFVALIEAKAEEILAWEDCVREAKKNHPDLASAEEELNQTKATKAVPVPGSYQEDKRPYQTDNYGQLRESGRCG